MSNLNDNSFDNNQSESIDDFDEGKARNLVRILLENDVSIIKICYL